MELIDRYRQDALYVIYHKQAGARQLVTAAHGYISLLSRLEEDYFVNLPVQHSYRSQSQSCAHLQTPPHPPFNHLS